MNWLFRFFLLIGVLVVIALFSALLAPYFVNWERFTAEFEKQATRLVGQPVRVGGSSNLRLLPLPFISFEDLEVGRNEDGTPLMTVERFSLNAELFPFLSGEVRIVEMAMLRPRVNLKVAENGTIAWTSPQSLPLDPEQINIEKLSIVDGSMLVDGLAGGRQLGISNIKGELSARSVLGPWRIDVNADIEGVGSRLKISTGTFQPNERSIRLKVEANRDDQPYRLLLDGPVKLDNDVLNWTGEFSLTPFSAQRLADMVRPVPPLPV
ncbi:MAG: AsmA family protein, partial [Pseudomonadota bacterium]